MQLNWRNKILPKSWILMTSEAAATGDETPKCPFLKPYSVRIGIGTKPIERECLRQRCQIWDKEEQDCSIAALIKMLRKKENNPNDY